MCTALKFNNCMGRNYDYEKSFKEEIILTHKNEVGNRHEIIGIGSGLIADYPMYYDAMNDKGLCAAGLAFTNNAVYHDPIKEAINVPAYNVIPYILGNYNSVDDFMNYLLSEEFNIIGENYNDIDSAALHWLVCDKCEAITIESTKEGTRIYENEIGVLTNNPPFEQMSAEYYMFKLNPEYPSAEMYESRGTETYGLPGGYTSLERFIKSAYVKDRIARSGRFSDIAGTYHALQGVEQPYGVTPVGEKYEYTIYSAVYDMDNLDLHVRTYPSQAYEIIRGFGSADVNRWEI